MEAAQIGGRFAPCRYRRFLSVPWFVSEVQPLIVLPIADHVQCSPLGKQRSVAVVAARGTLSSWRLAKDATC